MGLGNRSPSAVLSVPLGWPRRFAYIVLVFLFAGPAIGWSTFSAANIIASMETTGLHVPGADMLLLTLFFGYITGAAPALASGIVIAWWCFSINRQPSIWVAAALCGVIGVLFCYALMFSGAFTSRPPPVIPWGTLMMFMAMSAIAGAICTRLTRRWQ